MAGPPERDTASRRAQALVIETDQLIVRLPLEEGASAYFDIHTDPEVMRWLGGASVSSVEQEAERIERSRAMHD